MLGHDHVSGDGASIPAPDSFQFVFERFAGRRCKSAAKLLLHRFRVSPGRHGHIVFRTADFDAGDRPPLRAR